MGKIRLNNKSAVLAIFYCGCNQSKSFHIEAQNYFNFRNLQNFSPISLRSVVTRLDVTIYRIRSYKTYGAYGAYGNDENDENDESYGRCVFLDVCV